MEARIIKCFVASPSDVQEERRACDDVVESINRSLGDSLNIRLETVRWEKDAHAAVGTDGQAVINEQLHPEDADFFIGIFWTRFGAPTPRAESGTQEEFELAYKRWQETKSNRIQFYFKEENPDYGKLDGIQFEKVKQFKNKISACGMYKTFKTTDDFKNALQIALTDEIRQIAQDKKQEIAFLAVKEKLADILRNALSLFSDQPKVWIDRKLCELDDISCSWGELYGKAYTPDIILQGNGSYVIKAPPQYGLTCLAHYMRIKAWEMGYAWAYVDLDNVKIKKLDAVLKSEEEFLGGKTLSCVIIDSWSIGKANAQKVVELTAELRPEARIIIMASNADSLETLKNEPIRIKREFKCLTLLPLAKKDVRKAVSTCAVRFSADEDSILNKIVLNLEVLNIHRTPMNCWTLLKVAEQDIDIGPVNRTEMLEKVLFILFNLQGSPDYTTNPDAKHCEHILGCFSAILIKEGRIDFTEEEFMATVSKITKESLLDIDRFSLWNTLSSNKIIIRSFDGKYRFSATSWLYFFAAKQMIDDIDFRNYILTQKRYIDFPEIIEFYTGIDRKREDILKLLDTDLLETRNEMISKLGFPNTFNPLTALTWKSSDKSIDKMKVLLNDAVNKSKLPEDIKDHYSDKDYNFSRPYDQTIHKYVEGASFYKFIQQVRTLSRALRNSDFVSSTTKSQILQHIISGWVEIAKVMFVLTPILAERRTASFEGYGFYLDDSFPREQISIQQLWIRILQACPHNVIHIVKDDLSSQRNATLLYKWDEGDNGSLHRHLYMRYILAERPSGWERKIQQYINGLSIDSYYLFDIFMGLRYQMAYGYFSPKDESYLGYLIKLCVSRHIQMGISQVDKNAIPQKIVSDD